MGVGVFWRVLKFGNHVCFFYGICVRVKGFVKLIKNVKILEIEACATAFLVLRGFRGVCEGRVWLWEGKINNS